MPQVNFKVNYFSPDGGLLRSSRNPHEVPDDWHLPPGTEVVDKDGKVTGTVDAAGDIVPVEKPVAVKK